MKPAARSTMVRINLLRDKKKSRKSAPGQEAVLMIMIGLIMVGVGVFKLVHEPLVTEIEDRTATNSMLQRKLRELEAELSDFAVVEAQAKEAHAEAAAIRTLNEARAVPAWFLRELSSILTVNRKPTVTTGMAERLKTDDNVKFDPTWDPKRIWVDTIEEKEGEFTIKGGSQGDADITQLALRLQVSAYFQDVVPKEAETEEQRESGRSIYRYTITGRVVY